jgi:tetratricopeptide (TPR) repeat protein
MKHLLIGMLCLFVVCNRLTAHPFPTDLSPVDRLAQNVPAYACKSIESLIVYGKSNTKTELEAVRFYFVWVAKNIRYDTLERDAPKQETAKQEPELVFKNRKGICRGYADLMTSFCQKAGIPTRTATGYCKTAEGETDSVKFHAWNVIKIADKWHLFDVTWASNYFEKNKTIDESFNYYFQQEGATFIKRHYPFDPIYQLNPQVLLRNNFFYGDTEGGNESKTPRDFNKILNSEVLLTPLDQEIKSYERAVAFIPEERRLYDVLSYFQSEKAHLLFDQGSNLLDKFRDIQPETVVKWTYKEAQKNVIEANEAKDYFKKALKLYESMVFIEENEDALLKQKNLIVIQKNVEATGKLIDYLESIEMQLRKIGIAHK